MELKSRAKFTHDGLFKTMDLKIHNAPKKR